MKKMLAGLLLLTSFLLISCSATPNDASFRLDAPININIDKNVLTFDPVEGATQYVISINSKNTTIFDTTYIFTKAGDYTIRIQAQTEDEGILNSLFSESLSFKVRFLSYPEDIQIVNNQLHFTMDEDADSYDVEINGVVYNTENDLPPYLEPGTYEIRIRALSSQYNESDYSPLKSLTISPEDRVYSIHHYQYSMHSTFEFPIYHYDEMTLNTVVVSETKIDTETNEEVVESLTERMDFYASNNTIYFTSTLMNYLKNQLESSGEKSIILNFLVESNLGEHEIEIEIHHMTTPYSFTGNRVSTNLVDDVEFLFDMFGYEFESITGEAYEITPENFTFEDGKLTINSEYLLEIYQKRMTSPYLEFDLIFIKDEESVLYTIFIYKGAVK